MSKVYLASGGRRGKVTRILEATPEVAKETFIRIQAMDPRRSIAVFGAKDVDTLKRTQPTLAVARVTNSVDDFIGHAMRTIAKVESGAKLGSVVVGRHKRNGHTVRQYRRLKGARRNHVGIEGLDTPPVYGGPTINK